ncbi:hypothetical protein GAYE_PCTG30G0666 [Galdieria yellowstonensis]|uniref:Uncharacterized protein n=1 Tax=Galdieria yellowstonensis TaxID=3028027 RepID=A0AAV9I390_9RHOD|nr:hypothetical protein GAYE_PCTG30G0666 [Galdieria yellowstonensis]
MFMAKSTKVVNRTVLYVRNFCSFAHTPKIRFRYAEEKAKKAGQLPNSKKDQPPVGGENNQVQSNNRKTIRLERAPKRMAMSKEEMEIIQLGGASP